MALRRGRHPQPARYSGWPWRALNGDAPTIVAISPFRGKTHTRHQRSTHMRWIRWPDFPGIHCVQPVHKAVDNLCGTVVCSQPTSCPEFHPLSKKR
jgi:hypothetical protein